MAQNNKNSSYKDLVSQICTDVGSLAKKAKQEYDDLDPETKKKVVGAIAGLGALLIGSKAVKKAKKKHAQKKSSK